MKFLSILIAAVLALSLGIWTNKFLRADFTTLDQQDYKWADQEDKWTVVNYFAEWCAPCLRELPELNHFHQQYADEVSIYAVSFDPLSQEQLLGLKLKYDIQFPFIQSMKNMPWQSPPSSLPTTYIIGPDGKLKTQLKGEQSADKLKQTIDTLKGL